MSTMKLLLSDFVNFRITLRLTFHDLELFYAKNFQRIGLEYLSFLPKPLIILHHDIAPSICFQKMYTFLCFIENLSDYS